MIYMYVISFLCLLGYWLYSRYRRMTLLERHGFKGPKPHFIFGNSREIFGLNNVLVIQQWMKEYGPIVGYYVGGTPNILCADPELLKRVQIKDFHLFVNRQDLARGEVHPGKEAELNVAFARKGQWKETRSVLTPTFSSSKLRQMEPIISDAINEFVDRIGKKGRKGAQEFDIYPLFQGLTMDVIGRTAFGIKSNCQADLKEEHPLITACKILIGAKPQYLHTLNVLFPEFSIVLYPLRRFEALVKEWLNVSATVFLYNVLRKLLKQRREHKTDTKDLLQQMIDAKMSFEDIQGMKENALTVSSDMTGPERETHINNEANPANLSKKEYRYMTEVEVVGNAFIFFEAGYETTSTTLAFVAHMMVNHLDVQEKMRAEVKELFEKDGKLNYNSLSSLPYMEAVIYEALRLYPPVSLFVTREASVDYTYNDMVIPKGTSVVAPVYHLHHNPDFWENPETFDPNRFLGTNKSKINPVLWQPFGTGPRNCIGMRFAVLELKLALAKLLLRYRLEPSPRTEIGTLSLLCKTVIMAPKHGIHLKAVPV